MSLGRLYSIFIFVSLLNLFVSLPIYFNEIELPTGDDDVFNDRNVLDLSKLSDEELINLEQALQDKIEEYEASQGYVEDTVPMNEYIRERRGGGRHLIPVINDENIVDLVPIVDDQQPILIIQTPKEVDDEKGAKYGRLDN
uniref:Uncharacterized protein n=1 Tax=Panagrolaimus sp. JU765 TaxID=591449 RepID=A0AC34RSL7_9BILA